MAELQTKTDPLDARMSGLDMPASRGWNRAAREEALARLQGMGLPGRRDEYWRFTNPRAFSAPAPSPVPPMHETGEVPLYDGLDRIRIVIRDGVVDRNASDPLEEQGLEIALLSETADADIHWARDVYGQLEAAGQSPVARPFASLNTAFATEGVLIRATGRAKRPIELVYQQESETSDAILHHCVKVEEGADVTLLETGVIAARANTVLEVDVADTGGFHHVRSQGRNLHRQVATHSFARLGRESTLKSFTLSVNGEMTRNEHIVAFHGDDAQAHLAGASIGDGADHDFHNDDTVFVTHDAVNCESRQVFKKVLKNGAVGVFQGKILVKAGAQKTDGYQMSQSLLLDEDSQFLAKPELEIYADDVACSHGSTTGAIDEEALFYLRSRGVPEARATDLLVLAFLAEALMEIDDETVAEALRQRLEAWLDRHAD